MTRRGAVERLGPPLLAWALFELLMLLTAAGAGFPPLQASTWAKWDAGRYLQIASRGYELYECATRQVAPPGVICGDAAWFPGISWLTQAATAVGLPQQAAMLLLVRALHLGTLLLVWNGLLDRGRDARSAATAVAALAFATFAPGAVYFHALFPMSLATCGIVGALVLVRTGHPRWAGLVGAVAATAYTTVVLLAPVLAGYALLRLGWRGWRAGVPAALWTGLGTVAGAVVVVLVMRAQTGVWDAFSRNQAQYAYEPAFPLVTWWRRLAGLTSGELGTAPLLSAQVLLVGLLVAGVLVWAVRRRPDALTWAVVALALVAWLVPLTLAQQSLQRSDALLLPLAVVVARLPPAWAWTVAGLTIALAGPLAGGYVGGSVV